MLRHAIDAATKSTANSTFVILGADADRLERELDGLDATPVLNPGWQEGIASSIRAGMNAIPDATDAVLLMLCDQPRVSTGVLDAIITRHHTNPASIVASGYAGTIGVPALFPRAFFPELRSLMGDKGAKQIMERHRAVTLTIPFPGGAIDIDTQDDLERMET
jgi:molybdenum cofactor cytidylyltransferase